MLKAQEGTEIACGIPTLLMGESLMNVASGVDITLYKESVGVFVGLVPFNFPAMISAYKMAQIYKEAGVPDGVLNVVTCSRKEVKLFLTHEDVKGITFVGSASVGKHIYSNE